MDLKSSLKKSTTHPHRYRDQRPPTLSTTKYNTQTFTTNNDDVAFSDDDDTGNESTDSEYGTYRSRPVDYSSSSLDDDDDDDDPESPRPVARSRHGSILIVTDSLNLP